jgi:mannose-6-phosphate isomerase
MTFDQPLSFVPLYQERVWGGRAFEESLGRSLPSPNLYGEAWEMVDRPEAQSLVAFGEFESVSLNALWNKERERVFGLRPPAGDRFPILAKILDARETLSVQVHPPEGIAARLGGEPKTEMWYVMDAQPHACIYAGFQQGVGRSQFEAALAAGELEGLLHRIPVKKGDAIFIQSGRCHAIGGGCLIAEIQQNSDTTYRVFDWNRLGADGRPRQLHVRESLESIDFSDYEPGLIRARGSRLVENECFVVDCLEISQSRTFLPEEAGLGMVLEGSVRCGGGVFVKGASFWMPQEARLEIEGLEVDNRLLFTGFGRSL